MAAAQSVEVTEGGPGRVSIRAGNASAAQIAQALTERTGIPVAVTGDAATAIDIDIVDEPLAKAVAAIAPNHLLMRGNAEPDSPITEIVLMMPDGSDGGIESTEFLPTGEPADGIVTEDPALAADGTGGGALDAGLEVLRDPDRAAAVRAAAASAVAEQAATQAAELAGGGIDAGGQDGFVDDGAGLDPATSLPLVDGVPVDAGGAAFEQAIDPATGLPVEDGALPRVPRQP